MTLRRVDGRCDFVLVLIFTEFQLIDILCSGNMTLDVNWNFLKGNDFCMLQELGPVAVSSQGNGISWTG